LTSRNAAGVAADLNVQQATADEIASVQASVCIYYMLIIECGAVPVFICFHVWALGNIAGDCGCDCNVYIEVGGVGLG